MQQSYDELRPEYHDLWSRMTIKESLMAAVDADARRIVSNRAIWDDDPEQPWWEWAAIIAASLLLAALKTTRTMLLCGSAPDRKAMSIGRSQIGPP
jgi:lysozyme family protein